MKKTSTTVLFASLFFTTSVLATGDTGVTQSITHPEMNAALLCKNCAVHSPLTQDYESKISDYKLKVKLIRDNKDWRLLTNAEELEDVAALLEANERVEMACEIQKKDLAAKYRSHRKSGNDASDEELVSFLLNYPRWDKLLPATREWVIAEVAK